MKCIKNYKDKKIKRLVVADEELEVTEARGKELIAAKVAAEIEEEEKPVKKRASKKEA